MRSYRYSYQTIVRYSSSVYNHHFLLRCTPRGDGNQRIMEQDLHLLTPTHISNSTDVFGNIIHYGSMMNRHDMFVVASSGVVECYDYRIEDSEPKQMFLAATPMTTCSRQMLEFAESVSKLGSTLDQAIALANAIYINMSYAPGVTTIETKAADSFKLRVGVCQDFAHILVALCRKRGIFARYVAGFVVGTGETHAWVEIHCNGAWYGVDPTHNLLIVNDYIKVAHGRDASDCSVTRGVHFGLAAQTTEVRVVLEPLN
ncbi:MAG: transglutaminase family protein [Rikenellaceae bacterium]